jgi:tetratricopeptide (TPR) repeat protein
MLYHPILYHLQGAIGLAVVALVLFTQTAKSQAGPRDDEKARQAFEAGRIAYTESRFHEAAVLFEQSFNLSGRPKLLVNLGNALVKLNERERAAATFRSYLRVVPDAPDRVVLEARIKDLEGAGFPADSSTSYVFPVASPKPDTPNAEQQPPETDNSRGIFADRTWTWVALAGSVVSGASSLGFWASANSKYDELRETCGRSAKGCEHSSVDTVSGRVVATNLLLGVSALTLTAAVVLYFIEAPSQNTSHQPPDQRDESVTLSLSHGLLTIGKQF